MFTTELYQLSYQALLMILILSGPPILISMAVGLFVAILQAATQIQEQTLSFTVKLIAVIFTLILMGGWLGGQIVQFTNTIFQNFYKWNP
ncbi:MAG TPA: type III secretion system export apparatus subunit SctS [Rhabdochlamydiaceae bacterium]|jgi:type III secretion protein S|nr:type III secretion system export apparatus subunit SctS [Rhabdochlamydiaceae bacterium]HEX4839396.1 type III secretion system export apparatus subunit SctS [Rhabdochlamydiaceae bacterium]